MKSNLVISNDSDAYSVARRLFEVVRTELLFHIHSTKYLSRSETALLYKYYHNMLSKNPLRQAHYFAQRIKNVVKLLLQNRIRAQQLRILDCGCGFGTESIIFALLGGKVLGIDLNAERFYIAKKRVNYYKELYPRLEVDFKLCNILEYKCIDTFDVVYAKEFISHVHPISGFLRIARNCLRKRGYLFIHDTNPLNPWSSYKAWKEHKHGLYRFVKDPETGKNILYAVERLVSPFTLKNLLSANGFQVVEVNFYVWPGPNLLLPLISLAEARLKIPVTPLYEIIAIKV
jgi:SAM-dependent methyltransferase